MGCCVSNEPPDLRSATEPELWTYLVDVSAEVGYRLSSGFDTGSAESAREALGQLNRRFCRDWSTLEGELRTRRLWLWLYRVAASNEPSDWDLEEEAHQSVVALLLGTEEQARAVRDLHARNGVDQKL